jgi:hypothetical protein
MDERPRRPVPDRLPRTLARDRRPAPDERDDLRAAERDLAELETSVQRLGGSGRGPLIAAVLIVLAFAVGLVRPWDWFGLGADSASPSAGASASAAAVVDTPAAATLAPPSASAAPVIDAAAAQTCDYPQSWRTATLQDWAGRRARVWTAVDAVEATGPLDSAIPFTAVGGSQFSAIGWCAPVDGPGRPPDDAVGTLFRVAGGKAVREAVTLLEPASPNPLAGLLAPAGVAAPSSAASASAAASSVASPVASGGAASRSPGVSASPAGSAGATGTTWPTGRYVIELATPDGTWVRWIGVELRAVP